MSGLSVEPRKDQIRIYVTSKGGGLGVDMGANEARRLAREILKCADECESPPLDHEFGTVSLVWGSPSDILGST